MQHLQQVGEKKVKHTITNQNTSISGNNLICSNMKLFVGSHLVATKSDHLSSCLTRRKQQLKNMWMTELHVWRTAECIELYAAKLCQLCPTLCDPIDSSPLGSSVYGILQARILEWVAIPFSRGSSQPKDGTRVSCIAGRFFTIWANREPCTVT